MALPSFLLICAAGAHIPQGSFTDEDPALGQSWDGFRIILSTPFGSLSRRLLTPLVEITSKQEERGGRCARVPSHGSSWRASRTCLHPCLAA
jgi:hypothetical protein